MCGLKKKPWVFLTQRSGISCGILVGIRCKACDPVLLLLIFGCVGLSCNRINSALPKPASTCYCKANGVELLIGVSGRKKPVNDKQVTNLLFKHVPELRRVNHVGTVLPFKSLPSYSSSILILTMFSFQPLDV